MQAHSNLPFSPHGSNREVTPIPWRDFVAELLGLYQPGLRAPATLIKMKQSLALLKIETTADLTTDAIASLIVSHPNWRPHTTWGILGCLRTAAIYAVKTGRLEVSPFALRPLHTLVRRPKITHTKHASREDIRKILDTMARDVTELRGWPQWYARRLHSLFSVVAYCGLRALEAQTLHAADVDRELRIIRVTDRPGARLKTPGSAAPVPMPDALWEILCGTNNMTSWLSHRLDAPPDFDIDRDCPYLFPTTRRRGPWVRGRDGCRPLDRLKAVARRAGVGCTTFLSVRHGWATHSAFWGVPRGLAQAVLRHTSDRTIDWYMHDDLDNLRQATRHIDF